MARKLLLLVSLAAALPALADDEPLSLQGFSGLIETPTAWTHAAGSAHFLYTNADDPRYRRFGATHTYLLSAGLSSFVEASGRITEVGARLRDLSLNAKLRLPLELVWQDAPVALAVGAQDEAGAAPHFRTRYAVASARFWRVGASVGYGMGPDRMKGVFGGASLRLASFAELLGDWDGLDLSAGARIGIPLRLGPVPFRVDAVAKTSLSSRPGTVQFGAGVTVPLSFGEGTTLPPSTARERDRAVRDDAPLGMNRPASASARPEPSAAESKGAPLADLQRDLLDAGFENVRVGVDGDTLAVEYENDVYARAEADALGVVLGHVAWRAPPELARFAVVLERTQLPLVEVSGPLPALRAWYGAPGVAAGGALPELLSLRWHPRHRDADWWSGAPARSSALRPQLLLAPGLVTAVATELSVLEYAVSLRPEVRLPLWPGALAYARWDVPFAWSSAYDDGGALRSHRPVPRLDHALLYQALPLAPGVTVLAGGGVFRATSAGALGELAWTPGDGSLALAVHGAYTQEVDGDRDGVVHRSLLGSLRYRVAPLDLVASLSAGRFYEGDRGAQVEVARWFGDTSVGVFYARTDVPILGVRLTLALGRGREMTPGLLQVRATPRWENELHTVVQRPSNDVRTGIAVDPVSPWSLERAYLDGSRLTLGALARALPRARAAFERTAAETASSLQEQ